MSESYQDKRSSHNIVKQIISKLKVVKHSKPIETNVMNDVENVIDSVESPTKNVEKNKLEETNNIEEIKNDDNDYEEIKSTNRFKAFCEEIEKFIKFMKNNEDLSFYIIKYPQILQTQINVNADELQSLLAEVKETLSNVKKLRYQQKLIKKEISHIKKSIQRSRDNETSELENIVSRYDKDMYNRWIKSKWKSDALEELLFDVQAKKLAMESLNKLIDRSLGKGKENKSILDEEIEETSNNNDQTMPVTSSMFSFPSKIPIAPPSTVSLPRPIPLTMNPVNRNNSRLSWVQRRFRAERRGNFAAVRPLIENQENEPFIFSINVNNNNANESSLNSDSNSNPFEFDMSRFSSNSSTSSNNQDSSINNMRRPTDEESEFKSEIRTVLQTLIDDRTNPRLMVTTNNENYEI